MFRFNETNNLDRDPRRTKTASLTIAVFLTALLSTIEVAFFNAGLIRSANDIIAHSSDGLAIAFAVIYFVIGQSILIGLIYLILTSNLTARIAATFVLAFTLFVEFSYLRAVGRFTVPFDITAALSATREQQFDSAFGFASFSWLPFLLLVIACSFLVRRAKVKNGLRSLGVWLAIAVVYYVQFTFFAPLLVGQKLATSSFDAFAQTATGYILTKPGELISPPKRSRIATFENVPRKNVVLVFDESIRADHLSLNAYKRDTTPYLEELAKKKILTNWGIAVSASTSSHPSYDTFITGATPELIASNPRDDINTMPTIFQYAKAMNYRTHLIDGQMKHYWGGIQDDLNYIDNEVNLNSIDPGRIENYERGGAQTAEEDRNGLKQWEIDQKLALLIREICTGSTGNFIFVYKRGVHFPYEKNFPKDKMKWSPIYYFKNQWEVPPPEAHDGIVNSYDNSIAYNLDDFFRKILGAGEVLPNDTTLIYTSDHGESFFTGGKAGHGGDTKEEAMVPLFAFGLDDAKIDTQFPASHSNVFTALLDLMNYPEDARPVNYAISLFKATKKNAKPRAFNLTDGRKIAFE